MTHHPLDYATPPPPRERWWHFFVYHPDWLTHWGLAVVVGGAILVGGAVLLVAFFGFA